MRYAAAPEIDGIEIDRHGEHMEDVLVSEVMLSALFLLTAALASRFLKKINFPYTIGLVVIGALLGILSIEYFRDSVLQTVNLSPDLILYIILPILIFDAAINIDGRVLLRNIVPILLLAVFGLLISTGIVSGLLTAVTAISFTGALLFGTLISATDPVAVIALFKEVGAPKKLVTLIDGESLFNDATAIVLFTIILSGLNSPVQASGLTVIRAAGEFIWVLLGGLLIGAGVGIAGSFTMKLARRDLIFQTSVSFVMAYLSFIIADECHVSGVMSTLAAGLVLRSLSEQVISRSTLLNLEHFWDYFSFLANSFVFLLLGVTEVHVFRSGLTVKESLIMSAVMIPIILIARAAAVFILIPVYNLFRRRGRNKLLPFSYQAVLFWGGLRGAVPVALVLAIPRDFAERDIIIHLTFAFILFTLLVQGTTVKKLMNFLGIQPEDKDFADRKTVNTEYRFASENLASLVLAKVIQTFDEEGFFIRRKQSGNDTEYLLRRRIHMIGIQLDGPVIRLTTEPADLTLVKTVMYETLLDLDNSLSAIKDLVKPEKLQELVSSDTAEPVRFNVMKYIKKENIRIPLSGRTKEDVLSELVRVFADSGEIADPEAALEGVMERERTMSTGLGEGFAFPHARTDVVDSIKVSVGVIKEGVDFNALDEKPVQILFLVLSPKNAAGPHLQVLSSISRILSDPETKEKLINAESESAFFNIIVNAAK